MNIKWDLVIKNCDEMLAKFTKGTPEYKKVWWIKREAKKKLKEQAGQL